MLLSSKKPEVTKFYRLDLTKLQLHDESHVSLICCHVVLENDEICCHVRH